MLFEQHIFCLEVVLAPALNIAYFIIAEGVDKFVLQLGREVVILEAVVVVVDSSEAVEADRANVEAAEQDAGGAHYARIERCQNRQLMRRRKGQLFSVGEVPVDHALLCVTGRIDHKLSAHFINPSQHSVAACVDDPSF